MWNLYSDSERAQELIKTIRQIKRKHFISKEDLDILSESEKELVDIQKNCFHLYENVTLFLQIRRFCVKCDKEDA